MINSASTRFRLERNTLLLSKQTDVQNWIYRHQNHFTTANLWLVKHWHTSTTSMGSVLLSLLLVSNKYWPIRDLKALLLSLNMPCPLTIQFTLTPFGQFPFLLLLETPENQRSHDVFRGYRNGTFSQNKLITSNLQWYILTDHNV